MELKKEKNNLESKKTHVLEKMIGHEFFFGSTFSLS